MDKQLKSGLGISHQHWKGMYSFLRRLATPKAEARKEREDRTMQNPKSGRRTDPSSRTSLALKYEMYDRLKGDFYVLQVRVAMDDTYVAGYFVTSVALMEPVGKVSKNDGSAFTALAGDLEKVKLFMVAEISSLS
ncbi:hypothetical protein PsorP6_001797 [Peronosclerospora sorghi]|uniref:Uncharacterized protein n=1 Tax=Peronosclerospora sorghi TaxID=230839 RepID=A0ACC0WSR6_9STRA|nr:hypothetical protein PsorP6_001797 [Peronosclerospora sorghi]